VLTRSLHAGTGPSVVDLSAGFTAEAFERAWPVDVSGPVYTALVPTQLQRLLDAGLDLSRYRAILLGGSAASDALLARVREAGARVVTTYGMSETGGGCVYDGRPLDGVTVSIAADGRIRLGGPTLFSGYRLRPDLSAEVFDGSELTTADLGRLDSDGRLEIVGRADDVVITGGVNVAAGLVTKVIGGHPRVHHGLVVGVPDAEWGQRLVAVIEADGPAPTLDELRRFAADQLEPAALPAQLVVVTVLPMLASGKPDRSAIAAIAAAEGGHL
jgi:O-succinylbenzoic acid--CoA ligase